MNNDKDYVRMERTARSMRADFTQNRPTAVLRRKMITQTLAVLKFSPQWQRFQPRETDTASWVHRENARDWGITPYEGRMDIYTDDPSIKEGDTVAIDVVESEHVRRVDGKNLNDSDAKLATEKRVYLRMFKATPVSGLPIVFERVDKDAYTGSYIFPHFYRVLKSGDRAVTYWIYEEREDEQQS